MALLRNLLALVVLALSLEVFSAALPTADYSLSQSGPQPGKVCKNPLRRKEWLDYSPEPFNDFTLTMSVD